MIKEYLDDSFPKPHSVSIRTKNKIFVSDEGHFILDLHLENIANPKELNISLNAIAGVVETGIFVDIADMIIIEGKMVV